LVEQKELVHKKREHESLHERINGYRTTAGVPLAAVVLFLSVAVAAIAYFTLAHIAHWRPFGSSQSAALADSPIVIHPLASSSAGRVPADYQGTWEGDISGPADSFEATLILTSGTAGSQVGVLQDETSGCLGAIYLESGDGPISLRIAATSNSHHGCALLARAHATRTSDGLYLSIDQSATVPAGEGTLTAVPATTHPPQ
jgi:hypothetical protein